MLVSGYCRESENREQSAYGHHSNLFHTIASSFGRDATLAKIVAEFDTVSKYCALMHYLDSTEASANADAAQVATSPIACHTTRPPTGIKVLIISSGAISGFVGQIKPLGT